MPLTPPLLGLPASRFPTFHPGQLEAALAVGRSPRRFSLLHAPTGAGKSLIAMAIARLLGSTRTLYLTATKGLQAQVLESFESMDMREIKGQNNYPCRAVEIGGALAAFGRPGDRCDVGPCKASITCELKAGGCDYYDTRTAAKLASFVDANYAYWMASNRYGDADREPPLGTFDLIIMDEAHRAADLLSSFCAVEFDALEVHHLTDGRCELPADTALSIRQWSEWAGAALPVARAGLADLRAELGKGARSRELIDAERLCQSIATIARATEHTDTTWITERVRERRPDREVAKFTPMWAHRWAEPYLYAGCPRVVMMSANLDEDDARYLGVPAGQYDYHEMGSTFPASRRPVIYVPFAPRVPVDRKMWATDWMVAKWLDRHNRIVGDRLDRKGIIQPGSYERAARIVDALRRHGHGNGLQVFTHHDGKGTAAAVDYYLRAKAPAVLVSPSIQEGYDFVGDKARYNIISKVPFIDSRDAVNAARAAADEGYGNHVAARSILQRAGRTTRTRVDWSECHLTDSHWEWFRKAGRFPKYFRAAFRQHDVLPPPLAFDDMAA